MSRVGRKPVQIPAGVKVSVNAGVVSVEGPKGKMECHPVKDIKVSTKDGCVVVEPAAENPQSAMDYGTTRSLINNMILGVTKGWRRSLELNGVGYGAQVSGADLVLTVGFSHDVKLPVPKGLVCKVTKNIIDLESCDRQVLGQFAASIRRVRPPEPYLGKGIKYVEETIRRKAGKTGA